MRAAVLPLYLGTMALRLCASCSRHVKLQDTICPFCGSSADAPVASPFSRATRSAMVFGSAAMVSAAVACAPSATPVYGAPAPDASEDVRSDASPTPLYGAPAPDAAADTSPAPLYGLPPPDAAPDGAKDATADTSPVPLYGLPPPPDAGADGSRDARPDTSIAPLYGLPP